MYVNPNRSALGSTNPIATLLETNLQEAQKEAQKAAAKGDSGWSQTLQNLAQTSGQVLLAHQQGKATRAQVEAANAQLMAAMQQKQSTNWLPYIAIGGVGLLAILLLTRR